MSSALTRVTELVNDWARDFADDEQVRMGAVVADLRAALTDPPLATGMDLTQRQQNVLATIRDSMDVRGYPPTLREIGDAVGLTEDDETGDYAPQFRLDPLLAALVDDDPEARAYRVAMRRLRHLHAALAGQRQDWANNTEQRCSSARAVAYQSAMQSVHSIIDEIEAIASGVRHG